MYHRSAFYYNHYLLPREFLADVVGQRVAMTAPSFVVGRLVAFDQPYRQQFSSSGLVSTTADAMLRSINLIDSSLLGAVRSRRRYTLDS